MDSFLRELSFEEIESVSGGTGTCYDPCGCPKPGPKPQPKHKGNNGKGQEMHEGSDGPAPGVGGGKGFIGSGYEAGVDHIR
jgi:hypothetical protein